MDLLVVADDLTGAGDTGTAFAERGYRTSVRRAGDGVPSWPDNVAVGIADTDSRYLRADEAAERVSRVVSNADAPVYKKVDSTLRGNLAAEVDAALAASDATFAVVAPAFPTTGRVTAGGYHLVDHTPVAETPAGGDPDALVETSFLPDRFGDSSHPVEHCALETVADRAALIERFRAFAATDETPLVVCDATTTTHLDAIGEGMVAVPAPVLAVGSGGLATRLRLGPPADVLGVVGSVAPATIEQLAALPNERVVTLDPEQAVTATETAVEAVVTATDDRLTDAEWVAVTAAREPADVERALVAGRESGLSEGTTKAHIADALAAVATGVADERDLDGLFATGGAVAGATLDALDAVGVRLTGQDVESGVPLGRVEGGPVSGLPVVTKAGGFGSGTAIGKSLGALARYDD